MKIKDLAGLKTGQPVRFKAVLANKKIQVSSNGSEFLHLTLVDSEGSISTPIFDGLGTNLFEILDIGAAYVVDAVINIWNNNVQLKMASFTIMSESEYDPSDFIPSYNIPDVILSNFEEIIKKVKDPYGQLIRAAIEGTENGFEDFKTAPSAEKHHGNRLGGLFLHTYGMLRNFIAITKIYEFIYGDIHETINIDRMYLKIIFHDIMKINEYEYKTFIRRRPGVVGHLIDGPAYFDKINEKLGNPIGRDEAEDIKYSILAHHGQWGPFEPKTLEDKLLHQLDMIDSQLVGGIESNE